MKASLSGYGIERRLVRPVTDQVVSLLVVEYFSYARGQIVGVVNKEAAGLPGQVIQTFLRIKEILMPAGETGFELGRRHLAGLVRRRQAEGLQASRIHGVDDDR